MTSHRLLRNVDVIHELCTIIGEPILKEHEVTLYYVSAGQSINQRDAWDARGDLCAVLMTCRTFMPIAMSVLWRSLPGLDPLLDVLGYDADDEDAAESVDLNWTRFEWYARRVKSICFGVDEANLPHFILDHTPLLPNLCALRWDTLPDHDVAALFFLPSLRRFELMAPGLAEMHPIWLEEIHICLDLLMTSPARLQGLRLSGCDTLISAQLRGFRYLKELVLPYPSLTREVWHNLALLSSLEQLDITYMGDDRGDQDEYTHLSFTPGFRIINHLFITGAWGKMLSVIRDLPSTKIVKVELEYPLYPGSGPVECPSKWPEIAQTLLTKHLQSFHITQYTGEGLMCNTDITTLEPVFSFTALKHLELIFESPGRIAVTDEDILRIVSTLPRLKRLKVALHRAEDTCLTVQSLVYVATNASKLNYLHLDINIEKDGINRLPDPQNIPLTSCPLTSITLRWRPTPLDPSLRRQTLDILARILNRLFPDLRPHQYHSATEGSPSRSITTLPDVGYSYEIGRQLSSIGSCFQTRTTRALDATCEGRRQL